MMERNTQEVVTVNHAVLLMRVALSWLAAVVTVGAALLLFNPAAFNLLLR